MNGGFIMNDYESLKLENQLCFPLYAASRKIVNLYTPFLKPLGLTYTQYLVFLVLSEQNTMTVGEICSRLYLNNGTLTPLLKTLEAKGYISRNRSEADERTVLITLTKSGHEMLDELVKIPTEVGKCVPLGGENAAELYKLLYKIIKEV